MTRSANIFFGLFTAGTLATVVLSPKVKADSTASVERQDEVMVQRNEPVFIDPWFSLMCAPVLTEAHRTLIGQPTPDSL